MAEGCKGQRGEQEQAAVHALWSWGKHLGEPAHPSMLGGKAKRHQAGENTWEGECLCCFPLWQGS